MRATLTGILIASAVLAGGCGGSGAGGSLAAWEQDAATAFTPLAERIPVMAQQRSQFTEGTVSAQAYSAQLTQSESVFMSTLVAAQRLPPYPGQPLVDRLYSATASIYDEAVKCELDGVGLSAGGLRDQVMLIATRLRELADRTFDQGRSLTSQGLAPAGLPAGSKVVLPAEVPDWVAEGLAAGPPLAPPPAPAARYPPVREGKRPTEAAGRWSAAVSALHIPSPGDVAASLSSTDAAALGALAAGLQSDSDAIGSMPDPSVRSGREQSVRRRLAILVQAEACRLGQVARLVGPSGAAQFVNLERDLLAISGSFPR